MTESAILGINFVPSHSMPSVIIHDIIQSDKAKTIDQAFTVIQHLRKSSNSNEKVMLDFSDIIWITSMFADRLVKALATFYGPDFYKSVNVTGIEESNVMFSRLWESAIDKFRHGLAEA